MSPDLGPIPLQAPHRGPMLWYMGPIMCWITVVWIVLAALSLAQPGLFVWALLFLGLDLITLLMARRRS